MIAAQILSIIAVLIAWIWWVSFIIGIVGLVLLQVIWCCRQSRAGLIASQVVSMIAAILSVLAGIFFLVARKDTYWCEPFTLLYDDDDWSSGRGYDYCPEKAYAIVAFVGAALWFASAGCQIAFLKSGRYDKWEATLSESNKASSTAVEMGNVETPPATAAAVATVEAEEYIPPEVLEKVDDA